MNNMCFDELTPEQIGKLFPIELAPYNPLWKTIYEQEKKVLLNIKARSLIANIEHIGSTSINDLAAKPIIDILLEIFDLSNQNKLLLVNNLKLIGYVNMYNSEQEKKMEFGKGYTEKGFVGQTFHLHIKEKGEDLQDEVYFRNYLKEHEDICREYEALKISLAEQYRFNRENYTNAKYEFVKRITLLAKKCNFVKLM